MDLTATTVDAGGAKTTRPAQPASNSPFDCFYVYPTVSQQPTDNANLSIEPAEITVAQEQASRFSQVCNVWAPMYRQSTMASLTRELGGNGSSSADDIAYASLLDGWRDYLDHYNQGRPIIFLGHSQGSAMLIRLLRAEVDPSPQLRKLLVSAIMPGGNVQVLVGQDNGGSFQNIPACHATTQTGCVIAFSSFLEEPPPNSLFGRPGQGVSLQSGQGATGMAVLCVNPADLTGGTGELDPYFRAGPRAGIPWVEYPGLYSARCETSGGATWLQVTDISTPADARPRAKAQPSAIWGLHNVDVNLALGNLVADVAAEEAAYGQSR